jgi:hypothetical protein
VFVVPRRERSDNAQPQTFKPQAWLELKLHCNYYVRRAELSQLDQGSLTSLIGGTERRGDVA